MIQAGKEEKQLAIERDDYLEGVPAITVIVDGGWSKWLHRHSYNANSRLSGTCVLYTSSGHNQRCARLPEGKWLWSTSHTQVVSQF